MSKKTTLVSGTMLAGAVALAVSAGLAPQARFRRRQGESATVSHWPERMTARRARALPAPAPPP